MCIPDHTKSSCLSIHNSEHTYMLGDFSSDLYKKKASSNNRYDNYLNTLLADRYSSYLTLLIRIDKTFTRIANIYVKSNFNNEK